MKQIRLLLVTTVALWLLTGCCWTDHSEEIKKIAEPMAKELERFYKEYKRFPTDKEKNEMLERVGCRMKGEVCMYEKNKIIINSNASNYDYNIFFERENTYCFLFVKKSGTIVNGCEQNPCIELGQ